MKTIAKYLIALVLVLSGKISFAQRGGHGHGHGGHPGHHPHAGKKVVVVKRSVYRPAKVVVFHPVWRPKYAYNRRWVYFPKYNLYWDNWRNHYYFYNGTVWVSQAAVPPVIVNVNLENEKQYELKENEDDADDIAASNEQHKTEYTYK
jgi:hypothetical protein